MESRAPLSPARSATRFRQIVRTLARSAGFRALSEVAPVGILLVDLDGRVRYVNRRSEQVIGLPAAAMRGRAWIQRVHLDDRARLLERATRAAAEARDFEEEVRLQGVDGGVQWICLRAAPLRARTDDAVGYVVTLENITERKALDETLRRSEALFRRLTENASDLIYRYGLRSGPPAIEYLSPRVQDFTGRRPEEFYTDPSLVVELVHPDDRHLLVAVAGAEAPLNEPVIIRWLRPDGGTTWAEHRRVPIYDEEGRLVAVEGIAREVSQRVHLEQELRESRDALRRLSARLERTRDRERRNLARELHDDLGQMLSALQLDVDAVAREIVSLRPSNDVVNRLQSLTSTVDLLILTVRRIAQELRPGFVDESGLVRALEMECERFQARSGIRCRVRSSIGVEPPPDSESSIALLRILQEALTNAARHSRASAIEVGLGEADGAIVLEVKDNGRGITAEAARNPHSLGLLGMRERAAHLGGSVEISGVPGRGTTILASIPIVSPKADADSAR